MMDVVIPILMAFKVALGYATWWAGVHLGFLGLDESNSSNDDEDSSEHSKDDDQYQINNPLHDIPSQEGGGDRLAMLAIATPTLGKNVDLFYYFSYLGITAK